MAEAACRPAGADVWSPVTARMSRLFAASPGSPSGTKLPFVQIRAGMFECIPADTGPVTWVSLPTPPPRKGDTVRGWMDG